MFVYCLTGFCSYYRLFWVSPKEPFVIVGAGLMPFVSPNHQCIKSTKCQRMLQMMTKILQKVADHILPLDRLSEYEFLKMKMAPFHCLWCI